MNHREAERTRLQIEQLLARARRIETPSGPGTMPWRSWGEGPAVVMLHGGAGSWSHWIRNLDRVAGRRRAIAPDLPGLGDAAMPEPPCGVEEVAGILAQGLEEVLAPEESAHLVAFSWGCTLAGRLAAWLGNRVRSLLLIGPAALGGLPWGRRVRPLRRRWRGMSEADLWAVNRDNLERLMIYDPSRIDERAVQLQIANTARARFDSPQFARSTALADALCGTTAPLKVLYGEYDAPVHPHFESRREPILAARPDACFAVIPGVGHWLQYEWDGFDAMLEDWFEQVEQL